MSNSKILKRERKAIERRYIKRGNGFIGTREEMDAFTNKVDDLIKLRDEITNHEYS